METILYTFGNQLIPNVILYFILTIGFDETMKRKRSLGRKKKTRRVVGIGRRKSLRFKDYR